MSARETALCALIACRKESAWVNAALKEYTQRDRLDRRDAALAARLCYGVVQNRSRLDFYLDQLLTGKVKDLHPAVRDILHLGLYQIYELDKIPESAAVNESVELVRKYCKKQRFAPGLVNAVLRNAARTNGQLKEPKALCDKYSHPQKLLDLLAKDLGGKRLEPMMKANNGMPSTVVQVNTRKTDCQALKAKLEAEQVTVEAHPWLPDCLVLSGTGNLEHLQAFESGLFYVQDAGAKLSVLCARIPQGARVLDCCAAPGGKSLAAAMAGAGEITSCDIHPHKIDLIAKGAQRLGLINIHAKVCDASIFVPEWEDKMDVVLADVPCSGYGIIRKKPDIRYKDPDSMLDLPALQLAILRNQSRYVKPGGTLLYSTCTLLRRENEDVIHAFLAENSEFYTELLALPAVFPENEDGMLTLVPGEYDTDGFFICRLRRRL